MPRLPALLALLLPVALCAQTPAPGPARPTIEVRKDLLYKSGKLTPAEQERCKLDLYLPAADRGFAGVVWLHGGALKKGRKDDEFTEKIARSLAEGGIAVASVNYRLSPQATYPAYIEDAAAAFAWLHTHIAEYGGAPERTFLAGHSAGAYLATMVGLNPQYLERHRLGLGSIAGVVSVAGQMMTHFTVREERGLDEKRIIADEAAPIHHVRPDAPPMLLILGDRDWPARFEENQYFAAAMKVAGHQHLRLLKIADRDHGGIAGRMGGHDDPARQALLGFLAAPTAR